MNIEDLTLGQIKQLQAIMSGSPSTTHPYEIGKNYLIRTVTYHNTGRLVAVHQQELVLEDAAWIADSGRFSDALKSCEFSEVEPFVAGRRVIIGRGSIIDAQVIDAVPTSQK